jgi:hypothetical protein
MSRRQRLALIVGFGLAVRAHAAEVYTPKATWAQTLAATRSAWLATPAGAQGAAEPGFEPFDTGPMPGNGPAKHIVLDVHGVRTLRLMGEIVEGVANCQIWGEPKLVAADGKETRLTDLTPTSVVLGWGSLLRNANWQNHPLIVAGQTFGWGYWIHANSEMRFDLGGRYTRFETWAGEDADRAVGQLRFKVAAGEPPALPDFVAQLAAAWPQSTGWLLDDLGSSGLCNWLSARPDARLERDLLSRMAPAAEVARLLDAPAGDARWLALYARAARARQIHRVADTLAGPSRAALAAECDALLAGEAEPEDSRWEDLLGCAEQSADRDRQWASLQNDLRRRAELARLAPETYRPEALIAPADRDPLDIVLRRTAALRADQQRLGADPAAAGAALDDLTKKAAAVPLTDAAGRRALFDAVCAARDRLARANPLLDFSSILFIKRHRSIYEHMCDQYYGITARPGGGLFVLDDAFGDHPRPRDLLAGRTVAGGRLAGQPLLGGVGQSARLSWDGYSRLSGDETLGGSFLSPMLADDGRTVYFAYCECRGDRLQHFHTDATRGHWDEGRCYHLFRCGLDGSGLTQLTDGTFNDFDPCPLPNGRVAFISERRGGYLRCGRACPNYNLYDMAADGGEVNCLSFHETNEWNPSVTADGRIIYTRWDYVDRFGCTAHMPWVTTLDGEDSRAVHGNFAPRQARPDMELDVRAIPGSEDFVATAAPHHGQAFGSLVVIDPRVPDDDKMAPVKRLTPDAGFPESQGGPQCYGTAWPLSPDYFLCVWDPAARGDYGLYLIDSFGNKTLLYRDPEIGAMRPIPVRSTQRAAPPVLHPDRPQATLVAHRDPVKPGDPGQGVMAVLNVYDSLKPWPAATHIAAIRVIQVLPMTVPSGGPPHENGVRIATAGDSVNVARWVLGTAPVEADGSACFTVPANRELYFQAIDDQGLAVQSMRSATYVRDGERQTCAGCHDSRYRAPARGRAEAAALLRDPSELTPDVDGSKPFSYPRLVQPVLDRACVACHQQTKAPNLGREPITNHWYASYNTLVKYGFTDYGNGLTTTPGRFGARASRLWQMLEGGHHGVQLSAEERHRLALWLDCASNFYGVYEKEGGEAQLRGEIVAPTLQ